MSDTNSLPKFELIQSKLEPLDNLPTAKSYIDGIKSVLTWDRIGLFISKSNKNLLILLITSERIESLLRVNLCEIDLMNFLDYLSGTRSTIELRATDNILTPDEIVCLETINSLWKKYEFSTISLKTKLLKIKFIRDFYSNKKKTGRGC